MRQLIAVATTASFAMLITFCAGCRNEQITLNSELEIGSTFPKIEGADINGRPMSIADFKGKVVLLDFFGDW